MESSAKIADGRESMQFQLIPNRLRPPFPFSPALPVRGKTPRYLRSARGGSIEVVQ